METRKLQQVGGGTFTVSIPKGWAIEHGLEAGSEVHLYAHSDGSIVVRSSEKDGGELGTIEITIDGQAPELVARALRAAHAVGYQTVTLRPIDASEAFTAEQRRAARRTKRHLVGTEVVVERADEITLRNLLDASDVSVRQSVVQLQFVALSAHRGATAALVDAGSTDRERLGERSEEADRLAEMVTRHFSRSLISMEEVDRLGVDRPELFDYHATGRELARITDRCVSIARAGENLPEPLLKDVAAGIEEAAETSRRIVDDAATAVIEGSSVDVANDVLVRSDEARHKVEAVGHTAFDDPTPGIGGSATEARALTRALEDFTLIVDHGRAIGNVALRAATRADTG